MEREFVFSFLNTPSAADEKEERNVQERVMPFRTFREVLNAIAAKYCGGEPDEFDARWNYVEHFDLINGNYQ